MVLRPLFLLAPLVCAACATEGGVPYGSPEGVSGARERGGPPAFSATVTAEGGPIIVLRGEPLTATAFEIADYGEIPLGRWVNGVPVQTHKDGTSFSADLENCSSAGCIVNVPDLNRLVIAKKGIADAVRLDLYDEGWRRFGTAAIDERGWVAVPMISPAAAHEVWVVRAGGRLAARIPHSVPTQVILRWRGPDLYLIHKPGEAFEVLRLSLTTLSATSATPIEPWWRSCGPGESSTRAIGITGDVPEFLQGWLELPLHFRDGSPAGKLQITESARPMTSGGLASPIRAVVDCADRLNVVTANGEDIWCLRYSALGDLLKASKIGGNIAGDAKTIQIDPKGRFYYLVTEMDEKMKPKLLHLARVD